jgi:photosystem II stability/assembly factor-like uncharacterized protein
MGDNNTFVESVVGARKGNNTNIIYVTFHKWDVKSPSRIAKSLDGGLTWNEISIARNMTSSRLRIVKLLAHPKDADIVYAISGKPRWGCSPARGFRSIDGGSHWSLLEDKGSVLDIDVDPIDKNIIYMTTFTAKPCQPADETDFSMEEYILNDGAGALFKSVDQGGTFGNAIFNQTGIISVGVNNPSKIQLVNILTMQNAWWMEDEQENSTGTWESNNGGTTWIHVGSVANWDAGYSTNPYSAFGFPFSGLSKTLTKDIFNSDRLYGSNGWTMGTFDGGRTFKHLGNKYRHVDDHAIWIDHADTKHLLIGGDGGLYETFDRGKSIRFFSNLPCTQNYRVGIDNDEPFYNVYYGTQDNNSWGGPSRTTQSGGITNDFWYQVVGGDGYQARIDPNNPDIVYAQWQYGNLIRYDRKSGEVFYIKPQPEKDEMLRWNWDTPLIISTHSPTRIYIAANRVFRSDNRGDKWTAISPDLTRQIDRNLLPIMGKVWGPDAVAKNASTSLYGNIVALAESPLNENLLAVGTDDGLIQITEDGGKSWNKISSFTGVPDTTYVSDIFLSQHNENVIYATFNNHKRADFKPYVLKSEDKGKSWKLINKGIPENHPVWTIYEDHKNPNLLFLGTEYSFFISTDGGNSWFEHKSGLPTIAVRDIEIQKRENDIVLATFGRGLYIMDDYSPLQNFSEEILDKDAHIFPVKDALMYIEDDSYRKNNQGGSFFRAKNPPFGATFTYYLKESIKTKKQLRKEAEQKAEKEGKTIKYPSLQELQAEDEEQPPYLIFKIQDMNGNTIRLLKAPASKGIHRITWDMRYPAPTPVDEKTDINKNSGTPVMPGQYKVSMFKNVDGKVTQLTEPVTFTCKLLNNAALSTDDRKALAAFQGKVSKLTGAVYATNALLSETQKNIGLIEKALMSAVNTDENLLTKTREIKKKLNELSIKLNGNPSISKRNENQTPSITERLTYVIWGMWATNNAPTETQKMNYNIASEELVPVLNDLKQIISVDIASLRAQLQKLEAPWVPGILPEWKHE